MEPYLDSRMYLPDLHKDKMNTTTMLVTEHPYEILIHTLRRKSLLLALLLPYTIKISHL
jgi:hypothetical protein